MSRSPSLHRIGVDGLPVPRLRGRLHQVAALPIAAVGLVLTLRAPSTVAAVAIAIFTVSVVAMLIASAAYHCHAGSIERKLVARRLDHAMIFVAIAGTQTAYWLVSAPGRAAVIATVAVWVVAAGGIHYKLNHLTLTRSVGSWLYTALGWTGVAIIPYLIDAGDATAFLAVLGGGLLYTGGGLILLRGRLEPWPGVIGHHEVWHAMVVLAVLAHGFGIVRLADTST